MIAVTEAERLILENLHTPTVNSVPLASVTGYTLAKSVYADHDLPPYPRVAMDGIAIFWEENPHTSGYRIKHVQAAGAPPYTLIDRSGCVEVMTGAALPSGTNAIIPYEELELQSGIARVLRHPRKGQHIHEQGADTRQGELLLEPGTLIGSKEVAVLAAVGLSDVPVFSVPPVAIVATGNELVPVDRHPQPHQIRSSNNHALSSALSEMKIASALYHLADRREDMDTILPTILDRHPIVILSGGVSKGKYDLIPSALADAGVRQVFHQIKQKPGKPFWFGRSYRNTVFALPGNPVSTFLCFYRYIKPWLQNSLRNRMHLSTAVLAKKIVFQPPLTYFVQVTLDIQNGLTTAEPIVGGGSGDFVSLRQADGFLELPPDRAEFQAGEAFPLIRIR